MAEQDRQRLANRDLPRMEHERKAAYQHYAALRSELNAAGTRSEVVSRISAGVRAQVDRLFAKAADERRRAREERNRQRDRLGAKRDDFSEAVAEGAANARERRWLEETARPYEAQKVLVAVAEYDRLVARCDAAAESVAGLDTQLGQSRRTLAGLDARAQALAMERGHLNRQIIDFERQSDEHTLRQAELVRKAAAAAEALAVLRTQVAAR